MNYEIIYVKGFSGGRIFVPRISVPRVSAPRVNIPRVSTPRVAPREPVHETPPVAPSRPPVVVNHYHDHYHDGGGGYGGSNIWFWMYIFDRPQQPPQVVYQAPPQQYAPPTQPYQQPAPMPPQGYQEQPPQYQQPAPESHLMFWTFAILATALLVYWWMKR